MNWSNAFLVHPPMCCFQQEDWVLCRVICKRKSGGGATSKSRSLTTTTTTIVHDTSTPTSSPPLPPLMDTTLAQLQASMNTSSSSAIAAVAALEQVPCFSSFSNSIASNNNNSNSATVNAQQCYLPIVTGSNNNGMSYLDHGLPEFGSFLDTQSCDKKMLKAVLSQLNSIGGEVLPGLPPPSEMAAAVSSSWMNHF